MVENTSTQITLDGAKKLGLGPCKICKPKSHNGRITKGKKAEGTSKIRYQCLGKTKKGLQCRHITKIANSYCYQHRPKR